MTAGTGEGAENQQLELKARQYRPHVHGWFLRPLFPPTSSDSLGELRRALYIAGYPDATEANSGFPTERMAKRGT